MLMVVFGAGASYDSAPSRPPNRFPISAIPERPPLANQLFDDRPIFNHAISHLHKCKPIVPYLQGPNVIVEQVLERLQTEADRYSERHRQFAAIRYYLQFILWECVNQWKKKVPGGASNYIAFLDQLESRRERQESICLVTFNYDTMLEDALQLVGVNIRNLEDYIAGNRYKPEFHFWPSGV